MLARFGLAVAVSMAALCGTANAADPPDKSAKIRLETRQIDVSADGGFTVRTHSELQVFNSMAIQALAQRPLNYADSYQTLDVTSAYTLKPNGTKIPVEPGAILTQQAPNASVYSDVKQKVILFPDVEANDTLVHETTIVTKPIIANAFTYQSVFPTAVAFDKVAMTFVAPKSMPLNFEMHGPTLRKTVTGDTITYTVTYSAETPVRDDGQYVSPMDRSPRFFASSFKSYDDLSRTYAALALPKIAVTPKIQAKADEITAGVSDRRQQAQKIYEWVSGHIRYVALEFGLGSIVSHDAESVMTNGYGDCKDHATLFAALLKAKGIPSNLALINGTNSYVLPGVPVLGAFDHVITWLPEFGIFADTTQRDFPFGLLPGQEYGKSVVLVGVDRDAVRQTPMLPDRNSSYALTETLKLDDKEQLSAQSTLTASGLTGEYMRRLAQLIVVNGAEKSADNLLKSRNMPSATGTFAVLPPPSPGALAITATYQTKTQESMETGVLIPAGLNLESMWGDQFLGPVAVDKFRTADPIPCYGGHATEDYTFELPSGKKAASLPADTKIDTRNVQYISHWTATDRGFTLHREIVVTFDKPLCTGSTRTDLLDAIQKIRGDYNGRVALAAVQ